MQQTATTTRGLFENQWGQKQEFAGFVRGNCQVERAVTGGIRCCWKGIRDTNDTATVWNRHTSAYDKPDDPFLTEYEGELGVLDRQSKLLAKYSEHVLIARSWAEVKDLVESADPAPGPNLTWLYPGPYGVDGMITTQYPFYLGESPDELVAYCKKYGLIGLPSYTRMDEDAEVLGKYGLVIDRPSKQTPPGRPPVPTISGLPKVQYPARLHNWSSARRRAARNGEGHEDHHEVIYSPRSVRMSSQVRLRNQKLADTRTFTIRAEEISRLIHALHSAISGCLKAGRFDGNDGYGIPAKLRIIDDLVDTYNQVMGNPTAHRHLEAFRTFLDRWKKSRKLTAAAWLRATGSKSHQDPSTCRLIRWLDLELKARPRKRKEESLVRRRIPGVLSNPKLNAPED